MSLIESSNDLETNEKKMPMRRAENRRLSIWPYNLPSQIQFLN